MITIKWVVRQQNGRGLAGRKKKKGKDFGLMDKVSLYSSNGLHRLTCHDDRNSEPSKKPVTWLTIDNNHPVRIGKYCVGTASIELRYIRFWCVTRSCNHMGPLKSFFAMLVCSFVGIGHSATSVRLNQASTVLVVIGNRLADHTSPEHLPPQQIIRLPSIWDFLSRTRYVGRHLAIPNYCVTFYFCVVSIFVTTKLWHKRKESGGTSRKETKKKFGRSINVRDNCWSVEKITMGS